jgi:hypothetical protein
MDVPIIISLGTTGEFPLFFSCWKKRFYLKDKENERGNFVRST